MVFEEFLKNLKSIQDFFATTNYISHFQVFADIAANAKSGSAPDWQDSLRIKFEEIDNLITEFERTNHVVLEENKFLEDIDHSQLILSYKQTVRQVFGDIITADSRIRELANQLQIMSNGVSTLVSTLLALGIDTPVSLEREDVDSATFEFKLDSDVKSLKELGQQATLLNRHLYALSKLDTSQLPKDIELIVVSKASPLIIKAWISEKTAKAISQLIRLIMQSAKDIQELRSIEQDIIAKKLDNQAKILENAAKKRRVELESMVIDNITAALMDGYPSKNDATNGARNEVETGVRDAVEYFATQTSNGLEVRILPRTTALEDQEEAKKALSDYKQLKRELKDIRKFLPPIAGNDVKNSPVEPKANTNKLKKKS